MTFKLISVIMVSLLLVACDADDGSKGSIGPQGIAGMDGSQGVNGLDGLQGASGLSCWDLDSNGVADLNSEDVNNDGIIDTKDCKVSINESILYGDGSAGDLTIGNSLVVDWVQTPPTAYPYNNQYQNCDIQALQFRVPSGTVIRCNGNFKANQIVVAPTDALGVDATVYTSNISTTKWDSRTNALPLQRAQDTLYVKYTPQMGFRGNDEGNSKAINHLSEQDGWAGGAVYIYAKGSIEISDVLADAASGSTDASVGGGAGGLIVLLSGTSIEQTAGEVRVVGGKGSDISETGHTVGGGGGGGIIHMIAPSIGTINTFISGGDAGECITGTSCDVNSPALSHFDFGGAGGAFGGFGGAGQIFNGSGGLGTVPEAGGEGKLFQFEGDPSDVIDVHSLIVR